MNSTETLYIVQVITPAGFVCDESEPMSDIEALAHMTQLSRDPEYRDCTICLK